MTDKQQILFVQGGGKGAHEKWDSKLVASLGHELGSNFEIHYPRMPHEEEPSYVRWREALQKELGKLPAHAILVGHSIGGTMLLKTLSEQPKAANVRALLLISVPFVGEGGWPATEFEFPADLGARLPKAPIHFFHGLADETAPPAHVELYAHAIPRAHVHRLHGRDHQLNNDLSQVAAVISEQL